MWLYIEGQRGNKHFDGLFWQIMSVHCRQKMEKTRPVRKELDEKVFI